MFPRRQHGFVQEMSVALSVDDDNKVCVILAGAKVCVVFVVLVWFQVWTF